MPFALRGVKKEGAMHTRGGGIRTGKEAGAMAAARGGVIGKMVNHQTSGERG